MANLTFQDVMVAAGVDAAEADSVLWNQTPFPFDPSPQRLYKCASGYVRAVKNGIALCDLCSNRLEAGDRFNCKSCQKALRGGQ